MITFVAHSDITFVAADKYLRTFGQNVAFSVKTCIDGRFSAAAANGFDLGYAVCYLKKPLASGEEPCSEIRAKPEAQNGNIIHIRDVFHLFYLNFRQKLTFVADYDIDLLLFVTLQVHIYNVIVVRHGYRRGFQPYSAPNFRRDVAEFVNFVSPVVRCGLHQKNIFVFLFIIEFCHQRLCAFRTAHRAEFEIKLSHKTSCSEIILSVVPN